MNRIVLRLFRRHIGRIIFFALTIAVGIGFLFAIGNLLSTITGNISGRARELLTADVVIGSWRPLSDKVQQEIKRLEQQGYRTGKILQFNSMLRPLKSSASPVLISAKAIDSTYPMVGKLTVQPNTALLQLFQSSGCLIGRELALQHNIQVGDTVQIGQLSLRVLGVIEQEPDQMIGPGALAPRVLLPVSLVEKTGLIEVGSRIRYQTLITISDKLAKTPNQASQLKQRLEQKFNDPYLQITAYSESQPTVREVLRRTASFFLLASLVALLLGAIGMAASVTAFLNEQLPNVGVLRCLGFGPTDISQLYLRLCVGIGVLGGLGGVVLGYTLSFVGSLFLQSALNIPITPRFDVSYLVEGMVLAISLSVGLNYAAIRVLARLSPQDILRGQIQRITLSRTSFLITCTLVLLGLFLYTFQGSRSVLVATLFTIAMISTILACLALISLGLGILHIFHKNTTGATAWAFHIRHGLRQLLRQRTRTWTFLLALSIGLSLLGTLRLIQHSIVEEIRIGKAKERPNLFLVDIQPDQMPGVLQLLQKHQAQKINFNPLIRARLTHINNHPITPKDLKGMTMEARSRARFLTREYNLTYKDRPNPSEKIVAGKFWSPGSRVPETSLEERFANRIGVKVGDSIRFDIVGRSLEVKVTSTRTINWVSMMPNFFVVMPTAILQPAPQIFIGSVNIPNTQHRINFQRKLVATYPNVSAIQIDPILRQVSTLLAYFIGALQGLAWVCIGVGLLILAGTLLMGRNERRHKVALMRTLGSEKRSIQWVDVVEFLAIGFLSALIAVGVSWLLSLTLTQYMSLQLHVSWRLWLELALAGSFLPLIIGSLTNRKVYQTGVLENLRHAGA